MYEMLTAGGLILTMLGASVTFYGVYSSKDAAGHVAVARIASDDEDDWKSSPLARAIRKASVCAMWGLGMICVGTVLQLLPVVSSLMAE
ncbi:MULTISPECIES: hypothetical protein [Rhodobacterales]|uniref:hypothetical protein n=1 Tax=Rhodobacterales TaxID=204455 RepID=UPI0011BD78BF|nr:MULTISPECIES: hypothetical protein [Rhodobacterales]MDO6589119.1 hypothetical protein [Yoonia sp. 1_MG-2023]